MGTKSAWTDERRQRQRERIQQTRPWENSTGPRTLEGKHVSSQNAVMPRARAALHLVKKIGVIDRQRWRMRSGLLVFGPAAIDTQLNVDFPEAPRDARDKYRELGCTRDVLIGKCLDLLASEGEMLEAETRSARWVAHEMVGSFSLDPEEAHPDPR